MRISVKKCYCIPKKVSEYDQEIPQSQTVTTSWHREEENLRVPLVWPAVSVSYKIHGCKLIKDTHVLKDFEWHHYSAASSPVLLNIYIYWAYLTHIHHYKRFEMYRQYSVLKSKPI